MPALREGQKFERYRIIRLLGTGVAGESYEAEDTALLRKVVLKLLHPWAPLSDAARRQFFREMQGIGALTHRYLAPVLDYGEVHGNLYVARRFFSSGSLLSSDGRLWFSPPLELHAAIAYAHQLAQALQQIHECGYLHGALGLSNIMVLRGPNIEQAADYAPFMLADVGLAHFVRRFGHSRSSVLPVTAAPEQIGGRVTSASDQFALAVILYAWISGRPPFLGTPAEVEQAKLSESFPSLLSLKAPASLEQEGIIRRALSVYPEDRYPSILAFADALLATLRRPSVPVPQEVEIERPPAREEPGPDAPPPQVAVSPVEVTKREEEIVEEGVSGEEQVKTGEGVEREEGASVREELAEQGVPDGDHIVAGEEPRAAEPPLVELPEVELAGTLPEGGEAQRQEEHSADMALSVEAVLPTPTGGEERLPAADPERSVLPATTVEAARASVSDTDHAPVEQVSASLTYLETLLRTTTQVAPDHGARHEQAAALSGDGSLAGASASWAAESHSHFQERTRAGEAEETATVEGSSPESSLLLEVLSAGSQVPAMAPVVGEPVLTVEASLPAAPSEASSADLPASAQPVPLEASVLVMPPAGQEPYVVTLAATELKIGRAGDSDLLLEGDRQVSRRHAYLRREGATFLIQDGDNADGVFVNGERLPVRSSRLLQAGDRIRIGAYELIFLLDTASSVPATASLEAPAASGNVSEAASSTS
jgi:serine/threonine protein kinase